MTNNDYRCGNQRRRLPANSLLKEKENDCMPQFAQPHDPHRRQLAKRSSASATSKKDTMSKTAPILTSVSHFSWHQYDFHYGSFALHALAASLEAAVDRVGEFLIRLQKEQARGNADRFITAFDAADVPLAFLLRNHGLNDVSLWITAFE